MNKRRDIRRLAMQVLYQIDVTTVVERGEIIEAMDDEHDTADLREAAADLALAAWTVQKQADAAVSALTPDWPTHRQPPVDRAILRLAYYEVVSGHAPVKVAINEAVELSKQYAAENSPAFINGVLDKLAKRHAADMDKSAKPDADTDESAKPDADTWLADAVEGEG